MLFPQIVQIASRPFFLELQLHSQYRQHGEQLPRPELGNFPAFEARQRIGGHTSLRGDFYLSSAHGFPTARDRRTQLGERLH